MNTFFRFKQFTVHQERTAMKVGTDGVLLGALASPVSTTPCRRILDIGTGTGLIAIMLAQRFPDAQIIGIDIDKDAVEQATENAQASPFAPRITIALADATTFSADPFDLIVSNPPYFSESLKCPDDQRRLARHADSLNFPSLTLATAHLLAPQATAAFIVPADAAENLRWQAEQNNLHLHRRTTIFTNTRKPAKRAILHVSPTPPASLAEDSLTLLNLDGSMSAQYTDATKDFYLDKR